MHTLWPLIPVLAISVQSFAHIPALGTKVVAVGPKGAETRRAARPTADTPGVEGRRVLSLTLAFEQKSPAATLKDLSEVAVDLELDKQDVYGQGAPWLSEFETEVASLLGKEAAMFCPSGVMAQLITLKIHAGRRQGSRKGGEATAGSFLCHPSSHLLLHEEGAHEKLTGFEAVTVGTIEAPASLEDLREALDKPHGAEEEGGSGRSRATPSCFVLELPHRELGGACTPGKDIKAMSELLKARGVAFHCDGARLWEAQPFYREPFEDLCGSFDSVYVSFYKGLGGMTGAMLVGTASFVAEARIWLRRFGGNVFTSLPYAVSCLHAFRTQRESFTERWNKLKRVTGLLQGLFTEHSNLARARFEPAIPHCSMVHCYVRGSQALLERARDEVLDETGVKVFSRLRGLSGQGLSGKPDECYFEWNMGPANGSIEDAVFVEAWRRFIERMEHYEGHQSL